MDANYDGQVVNVKWDHQMPTTPPARRYTLAQALLPSDTAFVGLDTVREADAGFLVNLVRAKDPGTTNPSGSYDTHSNC